jgi:hypothetical protein
MKSCLPCKQSCWPDVTLTWQAWRPAQGLRQTKFFARRNGTAVARGTCFSLSRTFSTVYSPLNWISDAVDALSVRIGLFPS